MRPRGAGLVRGRLGAPLRRRLGADPTVVRPLDVAVVLESAAGALRAGAGFVPALAAAVEGADHAFASGLSRAIAEVDAGSSVDAALERWAARQADPWTAVVADACRLGVSMGIGLAEALDRIAVSARAEADLTADLRVLVAPARASALLMVAMPVVFCLVVVLPDEALRGVLLGTGFGWACLVAGSTAQLAGAVWMRALVRTVR